MSDYAPGDIVDITIKGARVIEVCRHGDGNGDDLRFTYEAKDGDQWPNSVWAQAPGVVVEHVAPAEWPPREDDLWRDHVGVVWFAVANSAGDVSLMNGRTLGLPPEQVARDFGPLTLVYREDEQDGRDGDVPENGTTSELRAVTAKLRESIAAAREDLIGSDYYGHDEENFTQGIDNACGGAAGKLAASFTPSLAESLSDLLDSIAVEYDQPPCDAPEACNRCAEPDPVIIDALRVMEELKAGQS